MLGYRTDQATGCQSFEIRTWKLYGYPVDTRHFATRLRLLRLLPTRWTLSVALGADAGWVVVAPWRQIPLDQLDYLVRIAVSEAEARCDNSTMPARVVRAFSFLPFATIDTSWPETAARNAPTVDSSRLRVANGS
jgi:hypothetical protein